MQLSNYQNALIKCNAIIKCTQQPKLTSSAFHPSEIDKSSRPTRQSGSGTLPAVTQWSHDRWRFECEKIGLKTFVNLKSLYSLKARTERRNWIEPNLHGQAVMHYSRHPLTASVVAYVTTLTRTRQPMTNGIALLAS